MSKDQLEKEQPELFQKLLMEEITALLKKNKKDIVKQVHKRLRALAEVSG